MSKRAPFTVDVTQIADGHVAVAIKGRIDDAAVLPNLVPSHTVDLDLDQLEYISSSGIKSWIDWLHAQTTCTKWIIKRARPTLVNHFSAVVGILPKPFVIESFYAPFISETTFESRQELLVRNKHFDNTGILELPKVHDSAGNWMEPDFIPARYFEFLNLR